MCDLCESLKILLMYAFVLACANFFLFWISGIAVWLALCWLVSNVRNLVVWMCQADTWLQLFELILISGIIIFEVLMELAHQVMLIAIVACNE